MKTRYFGKEQVAYEECKCIKELKDYFTEEAVESDDIHFSIVYKDGSHYDNFDTPVMPKFRNIYSCVISGDWGYTYYNAIPRFEEDADGEIYYYCDIKTL